MPLKPGSAKRPVNAAVGGDGRIADNGDIFCCCMHAHTRVCESQCVCVSVCVRMWVGVCVCVQVRESITVSMLILHVTSSRFCICFLILYHFTYTFSHAHTEAHTHKHTCMISTQEEWRQPGTGAWLGGAEERLSLKTKPKHKKKIRKPDISNPKNIFWAHRASSKDTRLFLTEW